MALEAKFVIFLSSVFLLHFLLWFRPSEPYLVPYMQHRANLTTQQAYQDVFPIWTYCLLPASFLQALVAEMISYRVALVAAAIFAFTESVVTWTSKSLIQFCVSEVFAALYFGSIFLILATLFRSVPVEYFRVVSGFSLVASLVANVLSATLGQMLRQHDYPLELLFMITVCTSASTIALAIVAAVTTPTIKTDMNRFSIWKDVRGMVRTLWCVYRDWQGLVWSLYIISTTVGMTLATTYYIPFLLSIDKQSSNYLGTVSAISYSVAAGVVVSVALSEFIYRRCRARDPDNEVLSISVVDAHEQLPLTTHAVQADVSETVAPGQVGMTLMTFGIVGILACGACVLLYLMAFSENWVFAAGFYIGSHALLQLAAPPANAQLGKRVLGFGRQRYAAILGINSFLTQVVQLIVQTVIGKHVTGLFIPAQFNVFAGLMGFGGLIVCIGFITTCCRRRSVYNALS